MFKGFEMMSELLVVAQVAIGEEVVNSVNAREIHEFLGVNSKFADWIKRAIEKYDFIIEEDYLLLKIENQVPHQGGMRNVTQIDYIVTLDMAKELCMVENNPKGREARRYFIECEKELRESGQPQRIAPTQNRDDEILRMLGRGYETANEMLLVMSRKIDRLEDRMDGRVSGYASRDDEVYTQKSGRGGGRPWSDEEEMKLVEFKKKNVPDAMIARAMGRTDQAVRTRIKYLRACGYFGE